MGRRGEQVKMKAMVLKGISNIRENRTPLSLVDMSEPVPGEKEILIKVSACGVCHTELDENPGKDTAACIPHYSGARSGGQCCSNRKKGDEILVRASGSAWAGSFPPAAIAARVLKGMRMSVRNSGLRAGMPTEGMPHS